MRVLIVDDDPSLRRWTRKLLPRFDTHEAGTASEALEAITHQGFDATLIDACLGPIGDRSGVDLVRALRAMAWDGAAILVSGIYGEGLRDEAAAAGADAFLVKAAFDGRALRTAIERAVAERTGAPSRPNPHFPRDVDAVLADYLDAAADEDAVHAERAYWLTQFARAAVGGALSTEASARIIGVTGETLRLYARVGSRWSSPDLHHLLVVRRNSEGRRITVSHLDELAMLPRRLRDHWVERVFSEALTVRALRAKLRAAGVSDGGAPLLP